MRKKNTPTFEHYAKIWLKGYVETYLKTSTADDYVGILNNHVYPVFKDVPVTEINRMRVKNFLSGKTKQGLAKSTVIHIKNVIGGVMGYAVEDDTINQNPAHSLGKGFNKKLEKSKKKKVKAINSAELQKLLDSFKE